MICTSITISNISRAQFFKNRYWWMPVCSCSVRVTHQATSWSSGDFKIIIQIFQDIHRLASYFEDACMLESCALRDVLYVSALSILCPSSESSSWLSCRYCWPWLSEKLMKIKITRLECIFVRYVTSTCTIYRPIAKAIKDS